jgi:CRISPR/Cas system-associated protein Cas7 (RAMP superfamily)
MRGIPVGTLCATTLEQSEWYEFVDEIPADKNEDEDEVKLRFRQVNPHNKDNEIVAEQIRNPKPIDKVESFQTFSRQGFGYGQAYKEQRSYGDLYVENIIFPLWEVDRKLIDKDRIEQEETFERLDSMFDFA